MPKEFASLDIGDYRPISNTPVMSKVFEKIVAGKLFLERNSMLPPSQFLYQRGLGACDVCLHCLTIYRLLWTGAWREDLFSWTSQLHLIGLSHCGLLHS